MPRQESRGVLRVRMEFAESPFEETVMAYKERTAEMIDGLEKMVQQGGEAQRCAELAQDRFEEACMWATKALTTNFDVSERPINKGKP